MSRLASRLAKWLIERNAARASRIIAETMKAGLVKPFDLEQSKRYASYVPFWAYPDSMAHMTAI
jgi:hypothetical protein